MFEQGQPGKTDGAVTAFGPLLRTLRMAAGLSQEALAERARISTEAVGALERGTRLAPQRQTLALLIEALDLTGTDRERLEAAAVRPSLPRRRSAESSLVGVVSALRLPAPLTSFVGRELDLTVALAALSDARLVSLVGPGGVGKSRLALEVARQAGERFNEGVALVELAPLGAGAPVVSAFARALGVADEGTVRLLDRLVAVCGDGRRLFVVDNCEHVLDDVAAVVFALLSSCPNLRVIATTREPLRVDGEQIFRLGPLSADAALELFVDRAKAVAPYLQFPPEARRVAGQICRRVDGIPLAIELAASRADVFDLSAILKRLQERFKLLASHSRTLHPHHRTLRALVDWSYDLLDAEEARVFRRLGIFTGGGRFDDAEHILAFAGIPGDLVAELLARLHDKSLIDVDRAEPPRFSMLQTIHDYAQERLTDASEAAELETRFAMHYLELAVAAGPALRTAAQGEAVVRLSADIVNIRAALARSSRDTAIRGLGFRALGAMSLYWMRTGALTEGSECVALLDTGDAEGSEDVVWLYVAGAFIELNRHRYGEARAFARRAREAALGCADEWLATFAAIADCSAGSALGEDIHESIEAAYARAERSGDPWLIAAAAFERAQGELVRGDMGAAAEDFAEALERARSTGDEFMVCSSSLHLGRALTESDPARAALLMSETMASLAPGALFGRAACVEALAGVALFIERIEDAARLVGIACALRAAAGGPPTAPLVERVRRAGSAAPIDDWFDDGYRLPAATAADAIRSFVSAIPTAGRRGG